MMRVITEFELATRSKTELHSLFREVAGVLAQNAHAPEEKKIAVATLQNIARAIHRKGSPKP